MNVELREYIVCNYSVGPHVTAANWPCIYLSHCYWVTVGR